MSAEPAPSNKKTDIITRFKETYANAIVDAEVQAKHTATEGWQRLYTNFYRESRDSVSAVAKRLRQFADTIELNGTNEDLEKQVGEFKKELCELRETRHAFEESTVQPIKQCALDCQQIIAEAVNAARRQEQEAPLVNVGLEHLMRDAVNQVKKCFFDSETGVLSINDAQ